MNFTPKSDTFSWN